MRHASIFFRIEAFVGTKLRRHVRKFAHLKGLDSFENASLSNPTKQKHKATNEFVTICASPEQ